MTRSARLPRSIRPFWEKSMSRCHLPLRGLLRVNRNLIAFYWGHWSPNYGSAEAIRLGKIRCPETAGDLQKEFPGFRDFLHHIFGERNSFMKYVRQRKLAPLVREIRMNPRLCGRKCYLAT